ncbi:terminase small subunit [Ferrovum sp.]|jgi:phage terminase small subunit|uniref:terminase small subunit n=1 Tax=Ferrovum sp. TaxID=2609467 RepID=UPI002634BD78|nr:terminase small subunit [Ferrovum sp.]
MMKVNKLTSKQEKFCTAYITAANASDAYREAYASKNMNLATINRKAFDLLQDGKVTARIAELRASAAAVAVLTVNDLINELEEARNLAIQEGQTAAAVSATMGKAKLLGLGSEKVESKNTTEIVIVGGLPNPFEIVDATDNASDAS